MNYVLAFLIGGAICMLGQLIQDLFKLTPGHITSIFVMLGASLELFDIYDKLIKIASAGALLPITSFGHSLAHASYDAAIKDGFWGLFQGIFDKTATGIVFAIILSVIGALIFKPKE